jgi:hypothetical protein
MLGFPVPSSFGEDLQLMDATAACDGAFRERRLRILVIHTISGKCWSYIWGRCSIGWPMSGLFFCLVMLSRVRFPEPAYEGEALQSLIGRLIGRLMPAKMGVRKWVYEKSRDDVCKICLTCIIRVILNTQQIHNEHGHGKPLKNGDRLQNLE